MNLRPHQVEALNKIIATPGSSFLLGDEVGLGKTRVACEYAKWWPTNVLVVAPLSTFGNWESEANAVGFSFLMTTKHITNYEKLSKRNPCYDLIIWDESQKLKSYKTQRHKLWLKFSSMAKKNLYLSATPAQNPLEMKYLCEVIGIPVNKYWEWVKSFRGVHQPTYAKGGFKFRYGYHEDIQKLRGILNGPRSIRRTPDQINGWPELNRIINSIALNSSESRHYKNAFKEYREKAQKPMTTQTEKLVAIGQFKQRISELKLSYTLEMIENFLEQGKVVAVSCEYLASVRWLQENLVHYRVGVITGETKSEDRIRILQNSRDDKLDVILFTVKEGINLQQMEDHHRARIQINHDIRWSAMDNHQVEGRTHRAGRYAPVYWMTCQNTIDDRVAKVLKDKMDSMKNMMEEFVIDPIDNLEEHVNI